MTGVACIIIIGGGGGGGDDGGNGCTMIEAIVHDYIQSVCLH